MTGVQTCALPIFLAQRPELFGESPDIASKGFFKGLDTFEKRRIVADLMSGKDIGGKKGQIFEFAKHLNKTTEPSTEGSPTFSVGPRLFSVSGERSHEPELHPAFPYMIHGEDLGVNFRPVPKEVMLPQFHQEIAQKKGRPTVGYMDLTRNIPTQFLSEAFLSALQKAGHKKGGEISNDSMQYELTMKKAK
mgnify:CR=1 FL=1